MLTTPTEAQVSKMCIFKNLWTNVPTPSVMMLPWLSLDPLLVTLDFLDAIWSKLCTMVMLMEDTIKDGEISSQAK